MGVYYRTCPVCWKQIFEPDGHKCPGLVPQFCPICQKPIEDGKGHLQVSGFSGYLHPACAIQVVKMRADPPLA